MQQTMDEIQETMRRGARGVFHIGMTVSDVERSAAFYSALGFNEISRMHSGGPALGDALGVPGSEVDIINLSYDGVVLELIQYTIPGRPAPPRNNDVGAAHVCLRVENLVELHQRLTDLGIASYSVPQRYKDEVCWVYFRDPDGITVEMTELLDPVPAVDG
jgi:catechol 2,3-dioxygenase-like lactoylglutathione lyase family enzyme